MQKSKKDLEEFINSSPLVLAAVTEAVHRYYYDHVINDSKISEEDRKHVTSVHSTLWHLNPDWREIIKIKSRQYGKDVGVLIKSFPLCLRPNNVFPMDLKVVITDKNKQTK